MNLTGKASHSITCKEACLFDSIPANSIFTDANYRAQGLNKISKIVI